ncbi:unnamed protein product, partial [Callosobruchus maculatus]
FLHPFQQLNKSIWTIWTSNRLYSKVICYNELKIVQKSHEKICTALKLMSDCFSVQTLFYVVTVQVVLIRVAYVPLKLYLQGKRGYVLVMITWTSVGYAICFLIFTWLLARYCTATTLEARKLYQISQKISMSFSQGRASFENKALKEYVTLFAEQTNKPNIRFSTVLFPIDYSMLLMIFNSVTTYLIILLQF